MKYSVILLEMFGSNRFNNLAQGEHMSQNRPFEDRSIKLHNVFRNAGEHSFKVHDSIGNELSIAPDGEVHVFGVNDTTNDYENDVRIRTSVELLETLAQFLGYSVTKL